MTKSAFQALLSRSFNLSPLPLLVAVLTLGGCGDAAAPGSPSGDTANTPAGNNVSGTTPAKATEPAVQRNTTATAHLLSVQSREDAEKAAAALEEAARRNAPSVD